MIICCTDVYAIAVVYYNTWIPKLTYIFIIHPAIEKTLISLVYILIDLLPLTLIRGARAREARRDTYFLLQTQNIQQVSTYLLLEEVASHQANILNLRLLWYSINWLHVICMRVPLRFTDMSIVLASRRTKIVSQKENYFIIQR